MPEIRPYRDDDAEQVVRVSNAAWPDHPTTVEELRFHDENEDPKCRHARFVAAEGDQMIGYGHYGQFSDMYHPRKFYLEISVHPDHHRQGIGSALYDHLCQALQPFEPLSLRTWVLETYSPCLAFYQKRGFIEDMRLWESILDLETFDSTPYHGLAERLEGEGLFIRSFQDLASDSLRYWKIFQLLEEVMSDVPYPEEHTKMSFEYFQGDFLSPNLLPEGYLLMLAGEEYVGISNLWRFAVDSDLQQGITGVRRAYRRRGIALALKLAGIRYAQEQGKRRIRTNNEIGNQPMLALNEKLGFVRQPAWISLRKALKEES